MNAAPHIDDSLQPGPSPSTLLEVDRVTKGYPSRLGRQRVLRELSLVLQRGRNVRIQPLPVGHTHRLSLRARRR